MTAIIGINAYHSDAAACLVVDGELVAAAEEERFRRVKHWAGFPSEAIQYCLSVTGLRVSDIDLVAINQDRARISGARCDTPLCTALALALVIGSTQEQAETRRRVLEGSSKPSAMMHSVQRCVTSSITWRTWRRRSGVAVRGGRSSRSTASAISPAPRGASGAEQQIEVEDGLFPAFARHLLPGADAVPRLSALRRRVQGDGARALRRAARSSTRCGEIVQLEDDGGFRLDLDYFRHHREKIEYEWDNGSRRSARCIRRRSSELLGPPRDEGDDRSSSGTRTSRARCRRCTRRRSSICSNRLHERHRLDALALAGGCAMNSVANGKVYAQHAVPRGLRAGGGGRCRRRDRRGVRRLARASATAQRGFVDGPRVLGAGSSRRGDQRRCSQRTERRSRGAGCVVEQIDDESELCRRTAAAIADGQVVGWFQGRMEWGPRALGNRSILGDPRRADMKDILNAEDQAPRIVPAVRAVGAARSGAEWFEQDDDVPFMMQVYPDPRRRSAR